MLAINWDGWSCLEDNRPPLAAVTPWFSHTIRPFSFLAILFGSSDVLILRLAVTPKKATHEICFLRHFEICFPVLIRISFRLIWKKNLHFELVNLFVHPELIYICITNKLNINIYEKIFNKPGSGFCVQWLYLFAEVISSPLVIIENLI